jgi:hypothetical protein
MYSKTDIDHAVATYRAAEPAEFAWATHFPMAGKPVVVDWLKVLDGEIVADVIVRDPSLTNWWVRVANFVWSVYNDPKSAPGARPEIDPVLKIQEFVVTKEADEFGHKVFLHLTYNTNHNGCALAFPGNLFLKYLAGKDVTQAQFNKLVSIYLD